MGFLGTILGKVSGNKMNEKSDRALKMERTIKKHEEDIQNQLENIRGEEAQLKKELELASDEGSIEYIPEAIKVARNLIRDFNQVEESIEEVESEINEVEDNIKNQEIAEEKRIEKYEEYLKDIEEFNKVLDDYLVNWGKRTKQRTGKSDIEDLKSNLKEFESKLEGIEQKNSFISEQGNAKAIEGMKEMISDLESIEVEIQGLEKELENLEKELNEFSEEENSASKILKHVREITEGLEKKNGERVRELEKFESEELNTLKNLESRLAEAKNRPTELEKNINSLRGKAEKERSYLQRISRELDKLSKNIEKEEEKAQEIYKAWVENIEAVRNGKNKPSEMEIIGNKNRDHEQAWKTAVKSYENYSSEKAVESGDFDPYSYVKYIFEDGGSTGHIGLLRLLEELDKSMRSAQNILNQEKENLRF